MIRFKIASRLPALAGFKRAKTMTFLWALLALVLHVIPGAVGPAHAQGSRKDDIVFNSRGIPLAGATVRVCAMPATGQPCTPLALIYSDAALTQALANPTTTDGLGNYFFYAAPGKYEIEISGPGITTKQIPNVLLPNDPSSPSFSAVSAFSLNLSGNLTVNGNTTVVGNLASGTLNLANQGTPPGAAGSGTVNLYTKTADKRLYYKDDTGTELGPLGPGAQTNVANNWTAQQNFNANQRFKGPNPYVDVTAYGVRDVNPSTTPAAVGLTASISSVTNPTVATISSASTFQNGDGVVIYGAGAPHSMTTPGAPTVTPSVARVGTGTGDVVNGPSGSTTYNYQIIARDKNGGLTAASAVGSTTTGAASLGSQSVAITSSLRANDVVTVVTSAAHGLTAGSMVYINGTSDNSFGGWYQVATAVDSTHFTFTSGLDTRNGATTSSAGGTVFWFNCNHLTWTAVTGAWEYYIYGRTGASLTLLGVSRPNDTFTDLTFDDFGSPMMDNISLPPFVPSTPPSVATSDHLVTTIVSGAGTTTLTLANAASTTVSGATIRFDNAPNLLTAAANNSSIYIPVPTTGGSYVVNSFLDLTAYNPTVIAPGGLWLNETVQIGASSKWYGEPFQQKGSAPQFSFKYEPSISVNTANPGIYVRNANTITFSDFLFSSSPSNGALLMVVDGAFNHTFDNLSFSTGGGVPTNDYMSVGLLMRGAFGNAAYSNHFRKLAFSGGPAQTNGVSATPLWYCNDCGVTEMDSVFLTRRGLLFRPDASGGFLKIGFGYEQGGITPFLTVTGISTAGNAGGNLDIQHTTLDTMAHPLVAYLPSVGSYGPGVNVFQDVGPSSGVSGVTGNRFSGGVSGASGQNRDTAGLSTGNAYDSIFASGNAAAGPYSNFTANAAISTSPSYPIFINGAVPAQPTCSVSSGGSVSVGNHTYRVVPIWQNGAEGVYSPASATCTTTTGNQTVTVNWTAVAGNAKGYDIFQDNILITDTGQCIPPIYSGGTLNSHVFSSGVISCGAINGGIPAGGPTMLMPGTQGMATPSINIGGGGVLGPPSAGFTATRTQTLPDVTGYIPVTSYVNSAYDNATRANGAIGSNWTLTNNGINISSNNFVGTTASNDAAYWSASPFSNVQFSQVTITALNGTTDFPGVAVLLSGSGASTQGYECVEDTTNIFIQKISGTTNTTLTSAASSGAAGDILRLEVAPGGALTCYKNGVSTLTTTDTSYTAGAPGLFLFGTVATSKNWSGGNLHPLAQLDSEQDWTRTQHFAQGIALGGVASESFNNNPRAEQNAFLPGALTSTWTGATWTIDKAVTITRVQVQAKTAPAGCTTSAIVRLTDGTTPVNVTISAAANDSGPISQNYPAGSSLTVAVQTAAAGCTTSPADANVVVQYRMQ
jgi:hypothetical protein